MSTRISKLLVVPKCPVCQEPVRWQRRWLKPWIWARWPCHKCGSLLGFDKNWRNVTGLPVVVILLTGIGLYFFAKAPIDPPPLVDIALDVGRMIQRPLLLLILFCIALPSFLLPDRIILVHKKQTAAQLEDSR